MLNTNSVPQLQPLRPDQTTAVNIGDLSSIQKEDPSIISSNKIDTKLPKYLPITGSFLPGTSSGDSLVSVQSRLKANVDYFTIAQGSGTLSGNVTLNDNLSTNYEVNFSSLSSRSLPTFRGTATLAENGDFTYTPNSTAFGNDLMFYTLTDKNTGVKSSSAVIIKINPKEIPNGVDDSFSLDEDNIIVNNVTRNDGINQFTRSRINENVKNGELIFNEYGQFTYTPNSNFFGADSFTYVNNNGTSDSRIVTVNLTVNPVNDATISVNDFFTLNENNSFNGNVLLNDFDIDSNDLSVILINDSSNGLLSLNDNGEFNYTPNANFNGTDSFSYQIFDGQLLSEIATVNLTVNPVNHAPIANNDNFQLTSDKIIKFSDILANDIDMDGDAIRVSNITNRNGVDLDIDANGDVIIFAQRNFTGLASFNYTITDGNLSSQNATVTINYLPPEKINQAPIGVDDVFNVTGAFSGNVLRNDSDPDGDSIRFGAFHLVDPHGSFEFNFNGNGDFTYTPTPGFTGTATIYYHPHDGRLSGNLTKVTVNVSNPVQEFSSFDGYGLVDASKAVAKAINQAPFAEVANTNTSNLDLIKAPEVWAKGYTGQGVIVAVLDTGVGLNYSGINYWKNINEIANNGLDDDGNGYIDDYDGWNSYDNNGTISAGDHGTHVAGIIGDRNHGVAYGAKIMPVQVFGAGASWYAVERGIYYAVNNGANVINMSLGSGAFDFIKTALAYAESKGVIVVSAAGNSGGESIGVSPIYPAGFATEYGIAVGSTNTSGGLSYFSNRAGLDPKMIYVTAPGENISSVNGDKSGTSMASPHVAGVVALMLSANPNLTPKEVKDTLIGTTRRTQLSELAEFAPELVEELFIENETF
jgi:subtilisin family serine protease